MCGICGIVNSDPACSIDSQRLMAMRDSMTYRGPDDAGLYVSPGVALGSRRLAIIDLSERGCMPMGTSCGRYQIAYNGEVYNHKELRERLISKGYRFRSNTDTEVIVNLFADEGPAMLDRLNGMFAIAIWDCEKRSLFLARDRMGVKPLYYAFKDGSLIFASEEKGLFSAGVNPEFDHETWAELLCFRYVSGERTPFVGVARLLPGHFLIWESGNVRIRRWWQLSDRARQLRDSAASNPAQWLRDTFDSAVALRRISDVPVGVLLSGGLDSGSVAASLASQSGEGVASFTVRFDDPAYDEGPLARQTAHRWHLDYHELILSPDELITRLEKVAWLNDEPQAHANDLYLGAIAEYAKSHVTVLLSGEGSDETLGGYVRYQPLRYPKLLSALRPVLPAATSMLKLNGRIRKLSRFLALDPADRFVLFNSCDVLPTDLEAIGFAGIAQFDYRESVLREAKEAYPGEAMRQAMYSDQHTFLCSILDRNDRMTMGASIECRVPFLDYRIVEGLASLPSRALLGGKKSKQLLRDAVGSRLPEAVLKARKWGFGVPWTRYLREVKILREFMRQLPETKLIQDGPFDRARVSEMVGSFLRGENRNEALLKQLFMISLWHQSYFSRAASAATGEKALGSSAGQAKAIRA